MSSRGLSGVLKLIELISYVGRFNILHDEHNRRGRKEVLTTEYCLDKPQLRKVHKQAAYTRDCVQVECQWTGEVMFIQGHNLSRVFDLVLACSLCVISNQTSFSDGGKPAHCDGETVTVTMTLRKCVTVRTSKNDRLTSTMTVSATFLTVT